MRIIRASNAGPLAAIVYALTVTIGGATTPDYSHIRGPISALMAGYGDPFWLNSLFACYNVLVLIFAVACAHGLLRWALIGSATVGRAMLIFPMDRAGSSLSAFGLAHLVLAGLASLLSILSITAGILAGRGAVRLFSILSLAVVIVTGVLTAFGTVGNWPMAGLLERLTIGWFLVWLAVYAVVAQGEDQVVS